jgi:uncharacterized protein YecT (DUF1311 family)
MLDARRLAMIRSLTTVAAAGVIIAISQNAYAGEPPPADVAAVEACTDLVAKNQKSRPPHGPDEFAEKIGPKGRLAGAARLVAFDEESCIGVVATACLHKAGEMAGDARYSDCYSREAAVWDKRLNVAYKASLERMEKDAAENLRKAQRAWIAWRDAACNQPWATFQGLMANPMQAHCMLELTARQAVWMEGWAENP